MPDTAALAPRVIHAPLNYLKPIAERPRRYVAAPPPGVPETNIETEAHVVPVEDGRGREAEFTLDRSGFALIEVPTGFADWYDPAAVRARYLPEVERVVRQALGATRVVAFDHNVRDAARLQADPALREPAKRVHNDYTYGSAPERVRSLLPAEAEALLRQRFAIVNLWRPLEVVQESPLALADWTSIRDEDLVESDLVYADRVGVTYQVVHDPRHRWVYFPRQRPEEALLIKCYDSAGDGRARLSFHGAFDDPTSPPDAPPRRSIEVRTLVFWNPADA
ncbi:MAG: CmcJ/NvfI family oxidoreductase [Paracraurococcus sp.]